MRAVHITLNVLIVLAGLVTVLTVGSLYAALLDESIPGEAGMAQLVMVLFATIFGGITFALSAIGYLVARKLRPPSQRIIVGGLAVSVLAMLALVGAQYL